VSVQGPGTAFKETRAAVRAGGSSFYLAMRILGREQREAMFEVYSYCRAVDDIADCDAPRPLRLSQLESWRSDIDALYTGETPPDLDGLKRAIARFGLLKADFLDVIAGMEMDVRNDVRAPELVELELYCDRVACAVGRLSVRIFGMTEADGLALAHHLGRALQLTNILRDLDEDAAIGRLYLPREALACAAIEGAEPNSVVAHPRLGQACTYVAQLARADFLQAGAIMARSPRRVVRAPKIMAEVYREMFDEMVKRGWSEPRTRVHVPKSHLLWITLRHAFV
jgi:phytoene synthase